MTASLEVRVRDYLARNGTDVTLAQVAVHLGEPRSQVAAIVGRLDLDQPTHVEPEDVRPPAGPTLTYEETAAPKPKRAPRKRGRGSPMTARAATGRRSDCPCDGPRCRIDVGDDRHGTTNGYGNHRCRCQLCRDAVTAARRERAEQLASEERCPNCGGPAGLYREGTCGTCAAYERRTGVPRPPEVYASEQRTCGNCDATLPKGKGRRHGRCEPCARYFDRNGVERPERLWRHNVGADTASRTDTPDTATSTKTEPVGTGASRGMPSPARGSAGTAPTPAHDLEPEPAPEPPAVMIETVPCALCPGGAAAEAPKRIAGIGTVCRRCWRTHGGAS